MLSTFPLTCRYLCESFFSGSSFFCHFFNSILFLSAAIPLFDVEILVEKGIAQEIDHG